MEAKYTREVNHCYMSFQSHDSFDENSYELKMISANRIPALLSFSIAHIDSSVICQYDISSLQTLSVFCSSHRIHAKELTALLGNLLDSLFLMEDYLLSGDHLLLDPEYLYLNWSTMEFKIAYIPFYSRDLKTSLQNLMEYLLTCLGNDDQDTVVLAYRIYHELKEPNLKLNSIRRLLLPNPSSVPENEDNPFENSSGISAEEARPPLSEPKQAQTLPFPEPPAKKSGFRRLLPEKNTWKTALTCVPAAVLIYAVLHIYALGYLSPAKAAGSVLCILALFILMLWLIRKHRSTPLSYEMNSPDIPQCSANEVQTNAYEAQHWKDRTSFFQSSSSLFTPFPENEQTVLLHDEKETEPSGSSFVSRLVPEEKEHHAGLSIIDLDRDTLLLGYQQGVCDKVIPDPTVSRIHARITRQNGIFYLSDLSSRNGTFVNEKPLELSEKIPLKAGMHIRFGGAGFLVQ